ncbi:MAG: response regulator [Promethearchaeota archaeon]
MEVIKVAKIFIIDDDIDIVLLFGQFLEMNGHEIVGKAYNGEDAIKTFKNLQSNPDIILMDHRMPLKNGLETSKELLNMGCKSKIIFVSADYTARTEALKSGAVDFLEKPIDLATLIGMIKKYSPLKTEIS